MFLIRARLSVAIRNHNLACTKSSKVIVVVRLLTPREAHAKIFICILGAQAGASSFPIPAHFVISQF